MYSLPQRRQTLITI